MNYFIRPGGNYDPRSFPTLQAAIDAAHEYTARTGYASDIFDTIEKRGIVANTGSGVRFISAHAYANA